MCLRVYMCAAYPGLSPPCLLIPCKAINNTLESNLSPLRLAFSSSIIQLAFCREIMDEASSANKNNNIKQSKKEKPFHVQTITIVRAHKYGRHRASPRVFIEGVALRRKTTLSLQYTQRRGDLVKQNRRI